MIDPRFQTVSYSICQESMLGLKKKREVIEKERKIWLTCFHVPSKQKMLKKPSLWFLFFIICLENKLYNYYFFQFFFVKLFQFYEFNLFFLDFNLHYRIYWKWSFCIFFYLLFIKLF
jgi:hypothetical protein